MNSISLFNIPFTTATSAPLGHFPKLSNVPNPRAQSVYSHVSQLNRNGSEYVASVPSAFHSVRFNTSGGLQLRQKLSIKHSSNVDMMEVVSTNAGFRIMDSRSKCEYILSRNGPMLFLYETFRNGKICVVAVLKPSIGLSRRRANVFVPDSNQNIGSVKRKWRSKGFLSCCRASQVKAQPGFDILMMLALQFCYEAVVDYSFK